MSPSSKISTSPTLPTLSVPPHGVGTPVPALFEGAQALADMQCAPVLTWPCVLLHLGAHGTRLQLCHAPGEAFAHTVWLPVGTALTAQAFFKCDVPTPLEMEAAIAQVEDEVYLAHRQFQPLAAAGSGPLAWWSVDAALIELAELAGVPGGAHTVLTLDAVERLFQRLAYVAEGRPAAVEGLPERASFAAALLVLRELMHHMPFATLNLCVAQGAQRPA